MIAALSFPAAGSAQGFALSGRVLKIEGPDSAALSGARVVLHGITVESGAPLESTLTDPAGRYRLRVRSPDSSAVYVVSVLYKGVAYFTAPVSAPEQEEIRLEPILVYDTSSVRPQIELSQRHLVVRRREDRRGRRVLEILVLANRGRLTRIAPDTSRPVWQTQLPKGALGLEVGESDLSYEAVYRRGNAVAVAAPIPPGEKQILLSYFLPGDRLELTLDQPVARLNLLAEDSAARLVAGPLQNLGIQDLEGIGFARFAGNGLAPGSEVILQFDTGGLSPAAWWWLVVALAGVVLLTVLVRHWPSDESSQRSLELQLRAIEAALARSPDKLAPEELQAYRRRKAELEQLLRRSGKEPS
ncbi:MAG: hypothetical protein KatS3mg081_0614 [Gemmatimonadales bacterium]|nr:MAG: hypothetical protein KatS3mg081_0614 [Gemmatimonadales bacterium]